MKTEFTRSFWKSFRLHDNKLHWLYTNEKSLVQLENKEFFNKDTLRVDIYKGYETKENQTESMSDSIYYIDVIYRISNYFGDRSGQHKRLKSYVVIKNKVYQQMAAGDVKEVKRMGRELKGILQELCVRD